MAAFIVLFRGINVGGRSAPKADQLSWLRQAGCTEAQTYLQSGNAVVRASSTPLALQRRLQDVIIEQFDVPIAVLVKSVAQWDSIIAANPLLKRKDIAVAGLHVTLVQGKPAAAAVKALAPKAAADEAFVVVDQQVYLSCPGGYGNTKMSNAYFERALAMPCTTRNWRTMLALQQLHRT